MPSGSKASLVHPLPTYVAKRCPRSMIGSGAATPAIISPELSHGNTHMCQFVHRTAPHRMAGEPGDYALGSPGALRCAYCAARVTLDRCHQSID